jgi:hypothetical protein
MTSTGMTVMIVTFFNASGIDFGNFWNAHLKSKKPTSSYLTSIITKDIEAVSGLNGIRW